MLVRYAPSLPHLSSFDAVLCFGLNETTSKSTLAGKTKTNRAVRTAEQVGIRHRIRIRSPKPLSFQRAINTFQNENSPLIFVGSSTLL